MDTIIGLGKAGCAIADKFAQHPQYKVFKIDSEGLDVSDERAYLLERYDHPEKYEKNIPFLGSFFEDVTEDILFVVSGAGYTSAASLGILQQLSDKNLNILYIKPDVEFLGQINTFPLPAHHSGHPPCGARRTMRPDVVIFGKFDSNPETGFLPFNRRSPIVND